MQRQGRSSARLESLTNKDGATCSQGILRDDGLPVDYDDDPEKPGAAIKKLHMQEFLKDTSMHQSSEDSEDTQVGENTQLQTGLIIPC